MIKIKFPEFKTSEWSKRKITFIATITFILSMVFLPISWLLFQIASFAKIFFKLLNGRSLDSYEDPDYVCTTFNNKSIFSEMMEILFFGAAMILHGLALIWSAIIFVIILCSDEKLITINYNEKTPESITVKHPRCIEVSNKNVISLGYWSIKSVYTVSQEEFFICQQQKTFDDINGRLISDYSPEELVNLLNNPKVKDQLVNQAWSFNPKSSLLQPKW
jgi:hypothetical protein